MEGPDMVDVIHFLFEEDARYSSGEEAESVSKLRSMVYSTMYNTTYKYGSSSGASASSGGRRYVNDSDSMDFSDLPIPKEVKPYVAPTDFNPNSAMPFGSALDAPLG